MKIKPEPIRNQRFQLQLFFHHFVFEFQDERKDMEKRKVNEEHLRRVRERKAKEAEEKAKAEEAEKAAMGSASGEDKPASENLDDEPNEEVMNKQERE